MTFVKPVGADLVLAEALQSHAWFLDIPPSRLEQLGARIASTVFVAGQDLFSEGDPVRRCLLMGSGHAYGLRYTQEGDEKILAQSGAGALIGGMAMFMPHGRHPVTVRAASDGHGWMIDATGLRHLCEQTPSLSLHLLASCAASLDQSLNQIDWFTSSSAEQRLAHYVLKVRAQQGGEEFRLPMSRTHLATKLGMRAETLSRLFTKWRERDCLRDQGGRLNVQNADYLQRLAKDRNRGY